MSERPISYCTEMVRANRDGRKTNTRRVMNPQPILPADVPAWRYDGLWAEEDDGDGCHYLEALDAEGNPTEKYYNIGECPYGNVGDVLWVREALLCTPSTAIYREEFEDDEAYYNQILQDAEKVLYCADFEDDDALAVACFCSEWIAPSIMPRKYARDFLRITNVRVERLQDISAEDALAEGIEPELPPCLAKPQQFPADFESRSKAAQEAWLYTAATGNYIAHLKVAKQLVRDYLKLWDSIYAKKGHGRKTNPWLWVIKYQRLENYEGGAK